MMIMLNESIVRYLSLVTLPPPPSPNLITYCLVYLLGGVTLLPGVFIFVWYISSSTNNTDNRNPVTTTTINTMKTWDDEKKGWIRLEEQNKPGTMGKKSGSNPDRFLKFSTSSTPFYAVLRHGTLFCFDSENEKTCHLILPIHDYTISLHPTTNNDKKSSQQPLESELYGRIMSICLSPHKNAGSNTSITYYLTCQRSSDKEDWYFTLLAASRFLLSQDDDVHDPSYHAHHDQWRDSSMYDPAAMTHLQRRVGTQPWWYALFGRLFLGIYKTDYWRSLWHDKLTNKLDKLNTHLLQQHHHSSTSLDFAPLELQQIHMGDTIPCLTCMTLDTFDTGGHCVISGQLTYDGDLWAVIRTDFRYLWPFNNNKKQQQPAASGGGSGSGLVLTLKLRHCSGKVIFKVKPPPSNRIWVAFETMPIMDWQVTPIVWDKQIKWNLVTHLIQAKLKEMVLDTLVMPNMEDVPFFDSDGLGGIFGERRPSATHSDVDHDRVDVDGDQVDRSSSNEKQQQQVPMSKLVQGYISRIKPPHKVSSSSLSTLHSGSTKATKV